MEFNYEKRKNDDGMRVQETEEEDEVFSSAYGPKTAEVTADPFRKSVSMARTPPPRKSTSQLPEGSDKDKRKRSEGSPQEMAKKPREGKVSIKDLGTEGHNEGPLMKIVDLIERAGKKVKELYSITSGSRNTKVEIKELAEKLSTLMKALSGIDLSNLVEKEEADKPRTREISTQTEQRGRIRSRRIDSTVAMMTLEDCPTLEKWQEVAGRKWSPNLFTRTEVKEGGDILATKDTVMKVAISLNKDKGTRNKKFWERYPELQESDGDFAVLEQTNNLRGGNESIVTKKMVKIITDGSDGDLWDKLIRMREEAGPDGLVAVQQVPERTVISLRKMLECIFLQTTASVAIYTDKERPQKKTQTAEERPRKERDSYALVVEGSRDETYTEVLRRVKEKMRSTTVSNKIKGLRSTRDGRLLITTDKDLAAAERVAEILGEPGQQLKVSKTGQREKELALHIRGLDALTAKQDIHDCCNKILVKV